MCLSDPCRGWWAPGTHGGERKTTHGVRRTIWYRCEPGLRQHPCNILPALTRDALGCRRHDGVVAAALRLPPVARALRAADPSPGRNRRPALRVSPCRSGFEFFQECERCRCRQEDARAPAASLARVQVRTGRSLVRQQPAAHHLHCTFCHGHCGSCVGLSTFWSATCATSRWSRTTREWRTCGSRWRRRRRRARSRRRKRRGSRPSARSTPPATEASPNATHT